MLPLFSERTCLRDWKASDLDAFAVLNADPDVMRYFPRVQTRTQSAAAITRFQRHIDEHDFGFWAQCLRGSDKCIGMLGLQYTTPDMPFPKAVEIGWRLAQAHWGQGLAPEAAGACLTYAFEKLGLEQVISFTPVQNTPSRRVMEKIGMHHVPDKDFDHPLLDTSSPLMRHVFYSVTRAEYEA